MSSQSSNQNIGNRPSPPNMPVQPPQGHMFSQGQVQGQRQSRPVLQTQGQINSLQRMPGQFDLMSKGQGHMMGQNLSQGQIPFPQGHDQGMRPAYQQNSSGKENLPKQGDFPLMSGGDTSHMSPGQGQSARPMFVQPPPNTVPPFPNFSNPPPDLTSSNLQQNSQTSQLPGAGNFHSHTNFSHAPGTERPQHGRPQGQEQGSLRQPVPPNQQGVSFYDNIILFFSSYFSSRFLKLGQLFSIFVYMISCCCHFQIKRV